MTNSAYCSVLAQQSNAPLYGTAAQVDCWLLIEYPNSWHAKALTDNVLPAKINRHLATLPSDVAHLCGKKLRVLFIKQSTRSQITRPLLMLGCATSQTLLCSELSDYDTLTTVTAEHIANHQLPNADPVDNGIFLVCTNGQRDMCCGRFGIPLYNKLQATYGARIWQTSHLGGHRFAPNLLCLPSGLSYGFVHEAQADQLIEQHDNGLISLPHLRGRSHYPPAAQAAEYFLRKEFNVRDEQSLTLKSVQTVNHQSEVLFEALNNDYSVFVNAQSNAHTITASCGANPKAVDAYVLEKITTAE